MHNAADLVAATLDALLRQTVAVHEILVIDDASTDDSAAVVEAVRDRTGGPIRLIRNQEAIGVARARNRASVEASGEWIGFCDNDDLWHPRLVELVLGQLDTYPGVDALAAAAAGFAAEADREALASHPRAGMVNYWVQESDPLAQLVGAIAIPQVPEVRQITGADLRANGQYVTTQVIFRTDAFREAGGFPAWSYTGDDWVLHGTVAQRTAIPTVQAPLILYRIRATSQSHALSQGSVPLLIANLVLRAGGKEADYSGEQFFYRHLIDTYLRGGGKLSRAVGFALVGGGFSLGDLLRLVRQAAAVRFRGGHSQRDGT
jgi:glycosyltransferase involved in cell wall biosynthesis